MKRFLAIVCSLSLTFFLLGNAQNAEAKSTSIQSFKAGGTSIAIPPPTVEMTELGHDNRHLMDMSVAPNNRLIAGFVLNSDLPILIKGSGDLKMDKYAMVQVSRRAEHIDCGPNDFKEITSGAKEQFGDMMNSSTKEVEDELNRRVKALDLKNSTMSLGAPQQLGCLFSKENAYGFGMIMPMSMGGQNMKVAGGAVLMRVKQRFIFVYLYAEYKDEETVKWILKTTENWANAILASNK